jgi:hypothetical protein
MISLADLLFLVGVALVLTGCWHRGLADFAIGLGFAVCLAAYVGRRIQIARDRRRR